MSKEFVINASVERSLADTLTPVALYLKLRSRFKESFLLESTDYRGAENSWSFICVDPIAEFSLKAGSLYTRFPDRSEKTEELKSDSVSARLDQFKSALKVNLNKDAPRFMSGLFGYLSYDGVQYFEDIKLQASSDLKDGIPEVNYRLFSVVIGINHFNEEIYLLRNKVAGVSNAADTFSLKELAAEQLPVQSQFSLKGEETHNLSDQQYMAVVERCKEHIRRGDIFQIVPSRRFKQEFSGDDFLVYRALRSINPSPYLFYFDYGTFKIFGSSPEAQLVIKAGKAYSFPIAGTYRRSGDELSDQKLAEKLSADPKENAEHVMLVDLARNDLSRNCEQVTVESYREVHFYSHVIHLVSKVSGKLLPGKSSLQVLGDSFPAGTLSGAPKHRAMQLIDSFEGVKRTYYGGAIGVLSFDGDVNHAIMIRTFLSKESTLIYQAGAGIVLDSVAETELKEVLNKLSALRKALGIATEIGR